MVRNDTMQKWLIQLQDFNWKVEQIKRSDNKIADYLSRHMGLDENREQIVILRIGVKDKENLTPEQMKSGTT